MNRPSPSTISTIADPEEAQRVTQLEVAMERLAPDADYETRQQALSEMMETAVPKYPPLEVLPCANVQPTLYAACDRAGKMACGACRLTSYCSKECQKAHWSLHKQDCKNPLRSNDWDPAWLRECRSPMFVNGMNASDILQEQMHGPFKGICLWGNIPAMDLINLHDNENDVTKDFNIAFVATGDLRDVVKTVNSLPETYSGHLRVLLNDGTSPIACRNLVMLSLLGTIPDEKLAADVVLHLWYSTFIPAEYLVQMATAVAKFLDGPVERLTTSRPVGLHSTISWCYTPEAMERLMRITTLDPSSLSVADAQNEYDRVRQAPSRRDFMDRKYLRLKPSHRVALQEFRRFGIVLPFGAPNSHFNTPNGTLFSEDGRWMLRDFADPLEGWDIREIIAAGKACGAQPEDVYGCFYFYLTKQLRILANRIRKLKITFQLSNLEACALSKGIQGGHLESVGLPPTVRFDRIDLSNLFDSSYIGLHAALTSWAPLLSESNNAVVVGYFMSWFINERNGRASNTDAVVEIAKKVMSRHKAANVRNKEDTQTLLYKIQPDFDAVYENSKHFASFLKKQGLETLLKETNLRLREEHTVIPHRLGSPLKASSAALPSWPSDEDWYIYTALQDNTWAERFVEFSRI